MGCEAATRPSGCAEFDRLENLYGWLIEDRADLGDGIWVGRGVRSVTVFSDEQQVAINDLVDPSWWYQVRNSLLIRYLHRYGLSGAMWDVGSGTGIVSQALRFGFSGSCSRTRGWGSRLGRCPRASKRRINLGGSSTPGAEH